MATKVYITRHGETLWNIEGRMQGWKDSALTEKGRKQAEALRDRLKDISFSAIYSSPTGRAYDTAEIVKGKRKIEIIKMDDFREIHLGDWEGLNQEELKSIYKEQLDYFWKKPHLYKNHTGESFEEVRLRTYNAFNSLVKKHIDEEILIITHTMALKSLMSMIENKGVDRIWDPPFIKQTSLTLLEVDNGEIDIVLNSDSSHFDFEEGKVKKRV